jgi:hypothetical protein
VRAEKKVAKKRFQIRGEKPALSLSYSQTKETLFCLDGRGQATTKIAETLFVAETSNMDHK